MASRIATHEHNWTIIAHTITKHGKEFKVLLGCRANFRCPATKIVQPNKRLKYDQTFWGKVAVTKHVCCQTDLAQYSGQTSEAAA